MDIDKLIETLRQRGIAYMRAYGRYCSICDEVITAISTLQAENEKLRAELEQAKRERDAAIADWRGFCAKCAWNGKQHLSDGQMDARCRTCRENRKCNWEWRGQRED